MTSAADAFVAKGLLLYAVEAAADAYDAYERAGESRDAHALLGRSVALAAACAGAQPAWWSHRNSAPELTRRENEIAQLAADGLASRAIADRLVVSVRTVDSHLYRVYTKLGVRDRASLAAALSR